MATAGGGTVTPATSQVGADGKAQAFWTLGASQGAQQATAQSSGRSVLFVASATPPLRWERMDSQTTATLRSIWGASGTAVWAVGDGGTIVRYDGTRWSSEASGTTRDLSRVWGSSATEVYAASSNYEVLLRFDGTSWRQVATPPRPAAAHVVWWVLSPTMAIAAVDQGGTANPSDSIMRWDGATWTTELRGVGDITAVWMDAAGRALAGGGVKPGAGAWNHGSGWHSYFSPRTFTISGTSFDDVWVTSGTNGPLAHTSHYHGTLVEDFYTSNYSLAHTPGWFVSASEVYVFRHVSQDEFPEGTLARYAGSLTAPTSEGIKGYAMWRAPSGRLFVVGSAGAVYRDIP